MTFFWHRSFSAEKKLPITFAPSQSPFFVLHIDPRLFGLKRQMEPGRVSARVLQHQLKALRQAAAGDKRDASPGCDR